MLSSIVLISSFAMWCIPCSVSLNLLLEFNSITTSALNHQAPFYKAAVSSRRLRFFRIDFYMLQYSFVNFVNNIVRP
jgi:hypothetical protein